jgi:hypothetical protein
MNLKFFEFLLQQKSLKKYSKNRNFPAFSDPLYTILVKNYQFFVVLDITDMAKIETSIVCMQITNSS